MSGIGVVLNPYSKKYKNNPHKLDRMSFIVGDKASCKPTTDIADLFRVADEFKSRDIDILAISGGDGTIHCTLSTFIKVYGEKPLPKIALLRGGTVNTIASTFLIRGETETLLSNLLIRYHEGLPFKEIKLRLTKVNGDYGCMFGFGVIYSFLELYYKNPTVNPLIAVKTLGHAVLSAFFNGKEAMKMFNRFDAEVIVDGKKWPFANYTALFTGSIRQIGFNFNVFYHMLEQNDKFQVCGVSLPPRSLITHLKKLHDGKPPSTDSIINQLADTVEIKLEKPVGYTIDGDMLGPTDHFIISKGPELTVLV